jgi:hypothetical protein
MKSGSKISQAVKKENQRNKPSDPPNSETKETNP